MKRSTTTRRWFLICPLAVISLALALAYWWGRPAEPPLIDVRQLDASARRTVQERLDDVRAHPRSGRAWGQFGTVLRAFAFPAQARHCFQQAQRLDPKNPRWPYFQSLLDTSENPRRAIAHLRSAVALCGNEPEAPRFRLAKLLGEQGEWSEAQTQARQLLAAKPDFTPATLLLAHGAQALGNYPEALALARRCTDDPRTARAAWSLLATLRQRSGQPTTAADAMRKAMSLPADASVDDPFSAEAALLRNNPREIATQTHGLLAASRLEQANLAIEQLVRQNPQFAEGWLLLGRLQMLQKQFPAAEQSLRHFLQWEPRSTQGLFQLGTTLLNLNRFPEAADIFLQATQIQPDFGPAHFNRGFALARAGKTRDALPSFRQALRHNPEHVESYLLLADLHRQLGENQQALSLLDEGLALNPTDPRLRQLRAAIK